MRVEAAQEWIERQSLATPILFLDLDGTVRHGRDELGRFVNGPNDVIVFSEVPEILRGYKRLGWRIVGISNQGGVALGILSAEECAAAMLETQRQCLGLFDQICFCTHHPDAPDPEYAICWCRKPRIGLILTAANALAAKYNEYYPPHLALMVGDRDEDRQCAENAGIRFVVASEWRNGAWRESATARSYTTLKETDQ